MMVKKGVKWIIAGCAVLVFGIFPIHSFAQDSSGVSECEKAGGRILTLKECDDSEGLWCFLSEKEQCYADQVQDGRCTLGEYSEELKGIVGITPRVLCNERYE